MPHCDPEVLSLRALGEPAGTAADEAHLRHCARCRAELDELRAVVTAGRSVSAEDHLIPPPDAVWDRISDELGLAPDSGEGAAGPAPRPPHRPGEDLSPPGPVAPVRPADDADGSAQQTGPTSAGPAGSAGAADRFRVRRRTAGLLAAAAAVAGLVVGGGAARLLDGGRDEGPVGPPAEVVVARAALDPLPAKQARGEATVARVGAERRLQVQVRGLPRGSGVYEVWLLNRQADQLVSLGVLAAGQATLVLPPAIDLARFPVVDVSLEPLDGNPAHSTDSYVRGTLPL